MTIAKIKKCDIIEKLIIRYRKECLNKMSVKVEKTENTNEVKLSFEIEAEKFDEAMKKVYAKTAKYFNIPGFRKGKAPMQMVEKQYGSSIFYEDTFNELVPDIYDEAIKENNIDAVSRPQIDIQQMEKGKNLIFTAIVQVSPEVKIGKYKGIELNKIEYNVSDEDIEHELGHMQEKNSRLITIEDRPVETKDIAVIDFEGFVDGEAFKGGKAEKHELEIGSNTFIPGFEDAVIGMAKGEEKDIELTFPEDYMQEDLKGQKVVFKVKVNEIKTRKIPELNKEFFEDLNMEGITDKESLEKDIKEELTHRKEHELEHAYEDACLDKAANNMKIEILPELIDKTYQEYIDRMQRQGITEELYLKYTNSKEEDLIEKMKDEAKKRIQYRYLLREIIKKENIKITDKEAKEKIKEIAKQYNVTEEEILKEVGTLEAMKMDLAFQKAVELVKANND